MFGTGQDNKSLGLEDDTDPSLNDEINLNDDESHFKSILIGNDQQYSHQTHYGRTDSVDQSAMFYSMMSESTLLNNTGQTGSDLGGGGSSVSLNESTENLSAADNDKCFDDEDRAQVRFAKSVKQTIEHLQNDVILANNKSVGGAHAKSSAGATPHNLFQTFRVSVRMFSLTVLHCDPIYSRTRSTSRSASNSSSSNLNSSTRRFIVERIKPICDTYFDMVSTIDTSSVCGPSSSAGLSSQSIDKSIVAKYHQVSFKHLFIPNKKKQTFI